MAQNSFLHYIFHHTKLITIEQKQEIVQQLTALNEQDSKVLSTMEGYHFTLVLLNIIDKNCFKMLQLCF